MLKVLSYLNIFFAFVYFVCYLQHGSYDVIAGMILLLVFNWQTLRNLETGHLKWTLLQYFTAVFAMLICLYLLFSAWNLISSSLINSHFESDLLVLEAFSLIFGVTSCLQCVQSFISNRRADSDQRA